MPTPINRRLVSTGTSFQSAVRDEATDIVKLNSRSLRLSGCSDMLAACQLLPRRLLLLLLAVYQWYKHKAHLSAGVIS
jgi:hypothetical protein